MKAITKFYSKLRDNLNLHQENLFKNLNILRIGDHYYYAGAMHQSALCIDLGANKGYFSEELYRRHKCRILLVEPNAVLLNDIKIPNSIKVNGVITTFDGDTDFFISSNNEASSLDPMFAKKYNTANLTKVKALRFKSLLENNEVTKIDLLKIDIEGAEIYLFKELEFILDNILQIAVEFHDFIQPLDLLKIKNIKKKLAEQRFYIFKISTLDNRQVLFINRNLINFSFFELFKVRCFHSISFSIDFLYYKLILGIKRKTKFLFGR